MSALIRFIIFGLVAVLLLFIGSIGAQWVWFRFHHRYTSPETGLYHGFVSARFECLDDEPSASLHFKAESSPRWYWRQPSNFNYNSLEVEWYTAAAEGRAIVSLPAFTYQSGNASGAFTRDVLAGWLFGAATNGISQRQHSDAIFGYFESAASGSLPRTSHHGYHFEKPVTVIIQHFLLGYGVGSTVYIWFAVWLLVVVIVGRRLLRTRPRP